MKEREWSSTHRVYWTSEDRQSHLISGTEFQFGQSLKRK